MGFFGIFWPKSKPYAPEGKVRKKWSNCFRFWRSTCGNSFLIKAIGKNISLVVHFGPIILVPNWIFEIMKNKSHAWVSLMTENRGVGWNRQTQCTISAISVLLFFNLKLKVLDLYAAKNLFSTGKGQKVWLIHLWRSRVNKTHWTASPCIPVNPHIFFLFTS